MPITHVFAGIPASGFAASLRWYERLLGRPPDRFPHDSEAVWQLSDSGLIYLIADTERAGHALVTLMTDDLEGHVRDITARGITAGAIETIPGAARWTMFTDPDGNRIQLGQAI